MSGDDRTPLVPRTDTARPWHVCGAETPIFVAGFIISLSFSITQVPILYVFHLMECELFYQTHPPYTGTGDRCSLNEVAAATATQFSILGMTTTLCGTLNLFVAGWAAKRFGPRSSLLIQTFVPAIRAGIQILGVIAGGRTGIIIFQCTQIIAIIGGPAGYILIVNIMVSDVVEPARRTSAFGKLQGCIMLGQGVGYLTGGMIGDMFGIHRPFQVALAFFLVVSLYARIALPCTNPDAALDSKAVNSRVSEFFVPLKILLPQRARLQTGRIVKHYGISFLCCGVFFGVLATDYAPFMIQMYATAEFDFDQAENGWLMSGWAVMRSVFLLLLFPHIIARGRTWFASRHSNGVANREECPSEICAYSEAFDTPTRISQPGVEPTLPEPARPGTDDVGFDLVFLQWSLVIDGALTTVAAFATRRWHIYLAAFLLPLGSGSAPAAKGVITNMCLPSQRADALNAITLIENIARLATQGLFGFLFAFLAQAGKAYLTFFCNAAIAFLGTGILLLVSFPTYNTEALEE